ncbi:metal ABC transporter ATP-binding protein [Thiomonas bhubaneswarensis]|uniref:ABC-type Mn2+/Zn2+ transport system, ATPase component n=1 Tax=Thiomonas bhubaneswarensis TaxID=339866 RepID=A0A0K6I713_9BURK|nr:metal ABC transporter ATP-binding protein [Thiomonas bhubaneswarensis]CUA98915.1 ABC-type Mn2+/Zn2+ transport system, ATPase component [Thiomonas bhubaneswarensis]
MANADAIGHRAGAGQSPLIVASDSSTASKGGGWAIQTQGLRCSLGGRVVLDGLDLAIRPGQFVGVFGANGAGKTTLLRALLGLQPLQAGQLRLLGQDGVSKRRLIGYVSQRDPVGADSFLRVRSYVAAAWQGERWGLGLRHAAQRMQAVEAALQAVDMASLAERGMDSLSGGQRQRARIAQALVNPVRILLLDEPLSNLDPQAQQRILQTARRLCTEQGLTVLMTAHDINPLLPHMDQVLYLAGGRGRLGTVDEVVNGPTLSALYGMPMAVARDGGYRFIHPVGGFIPEEASHCGHDHGHGEVDPSDLGDGA